MSIALQKNNTDCLPTCLSELLGIPYEEIPSFIDLVNINDGDGFDERLNDWLATRGYFRITFPARFNATTNTVSLPYNSLKEYRCIGILKKEHKKFSHAVVLDIDNTDEMLVNDPLGEKSDYSLTDITEVEFIIRTGG